MNPWTKVLLENLQEIVMQSHGTVSPALLRN